MQAIPTAFCIPLCAVEAPRRKPTMPYPLNVTCDATAGDLPSGPKIEEDRMRIAVIGTGGIGAPYGASLAKAGADVTFVARGAHLAAMREKGLRVEGDRGDTHVLPARATDDIAAIGVVDYVLLCVKLWDVESAGEQLRPIVGPETAVIPLQNGVDAAERLVPILGREAVMGGTAFVTGSIVAPGVVRQTGTYQVMTFGELDGRVSARGRRLSAMCEKRSEEDTS